MVYPTGPTDPNVRDIVRMLRSEGTKNNAPIWKAVAKRILKPRRSRPAVNLSKINRYTKDGDAVIVPGKVLSAGDLKHKVTITALGFSKDAKTKLEEAKCEILSVEDFVKKYPQGTNVKIIT